MRVWVWVFLSIVVGLVKPTLAQSAGNDLRIRVRDLESRGVAGITLTLLDAEQQERSVQTDIDGIGLVQSLPGQSVRVMRAIDQQGNVLLIDENDRAGGLRLPLLDAQVQTLDLRLTDGVLFVEPIAVYDGPIATMVGQAPRRTVADETDAASPQAATPTTATPSNRSMDLPTAVEQPAPPAFGVILRRLVVGVLAMIILIVVIWQIMVLRRSRRQAT